MEYQEVKKYFQDYVQEYFPYKNDVVFDALIDYLLDYYLKNLYVDIPKQHKYLYEDNEIKDSVKDNLLISLGVYKNVVSELSYNEKNIFLESLRGFYQFKGTIKFFSQVAKSFNDKFNIYELYADYDENNHKWILKPFPIYQNPDVALTKETLDYDDVYNEVPSLLVPSENLTTRNTNNQLILPYKTNIVLLDYLFINEFYEIYQLIFATYLKEYRHDSIVVYFQDDSYEVTLDYVVNLWFYLFSLNFGTDWSSTELVKCVLYDDLKNIYSLEEVDNLVKEFDKLETTSEISEFYQQYIEKIFLTYYQSSATTVEEFYDVLKLKNTSVTQYINSRVSELTGSDLTEEISVITNEIYDSLLLRQFQESEDEFKQSYFDVFLKFLPQLVKKPKETVSHLLLYNFKPYHVELVDRSKEIISSKNKFDTVLPDSEYNFLFNLLRADYLSISTDLFKFSFLIEKNLFNSPVDSKDFFYQKNIEEETNLQEQILKQFKKYHYNIIQLGDQFKGSYDKISQVNLNIFLEFLFKVIGNFYYTYNLSDENKKVNITKISHEIFNSLDFYNYNYRLNNQDYLSKIVKSIFNIFEMYDDNLNESDNSMINPKKIYDELVHLNDLIGNYSFEKNTYLNLNVLQQLIFDINHISSIDYNLSDESFPIPTKISHEIFNSLDFYDYNYRLNNQDYLSKIVKSIFNIFEMYDDNYSDHLEDNNLVNPKKIFENRQNLDDKIASWDMIYPMNLLLNINYNKIFSFLFNSNNDGLIYDYNFEGDIRFPKNISYYFSDLIFLNTQMYYNLDHSDNITDSFSIIES